MTRDGGSFDSSDAWRQIQFADRVTAAPETAPPASELVYVQLLRAIAVGIAACASAMEGR